MPRRPVKNPRSYGFQPGVSGNPAGKPPGATNKIVIAERVREAFSQLLDNNVDKLEEWLIAAAKKDPVKALDLWVRISERFVPMLSRTEITGKDGEAFAPITINLPNLPRITPNTLEGTPAPLLTSPGEAPKMLGETSEGTLDVGEDSQNSSEAGISFKMPQFALSPSQLKDFPEASPGDGHYRD